VGNGLGIRRRPIAKSVPIDKEWTRKRLRQQLRRLYTTGFDLGSQVNRSRNRPLHEAAIVDFNSCRRVTISHSIGAIHLTLSFQSQAGR
jgi:hypothetical protein